LVANNLTTPEPTVPQPSIAIFIIMIPPVA